MTDNWGRGRAEPVAVGPPRRRITRADRIREARSRRKRRIVGGFALAMLIVVVVGAVFLGSKLWHTLFGAGNDYTGDGVSDVVIQIHDGDSTTAIAKTLHEHKVVATISAFVDAAEGNAAISSIQPGFYKVRTEIPASNAVARLADPQNRVGLLVIPEGRQLDDIADVKTHAVTEGIFSLISRATCVNLDGERQCVSVDDLKQAASTAAPSSLSVPDWAMKPVTALGDDHRRLEGLISPGSWNIDPSAGPQDILSTLIGTSATQYAQGGLLDTAKSLNMSPYQILTAASLVQRESKPDDFAKVARVIYNRLEKNRKLELDSTVTYAENLKTTTTTPRDRQSKSKYNTYRYKGLPPGPISAPGKAALEAAANPEKGKWLYFVTVNLDTGETKFAEKQADFQKIRLEYQTWCQSHPGRCEN
jgi:UPF0755 protein